MLLVIVFCTKLYKRRTGKAMIAIKVDERASAMMGINTIYFKVLSFMLVAMICALASSIYATQIGYID